ncbi:hypothetical protein [Paenibacillus sp. MMO-177]|uniref:hypothetical protein n=1 Tax=Paenibacillus sp. MMO-177 TaxID=3081289 RepID=UPI0030188DBE
MQTTKAEKEPKYVRVTMDVWYNETDDHIHMTTPSTKNDKGIHTTVNNHEGSVRCHKNLYDKLKGILVKAGKYPNVQDGE